MTKNKKISLMGLLSALAIIMGYVEYLVPLVSGAPGIKLGLSNIVILFCIYTIGILPAFVIVVVKVIISAAMFQGFSAAIYGLAGGLVSCLVMCLLYKWGHFSIPAVSMAGGITHNMAQFVVAVLVLGFNSMIAYLPVLLISGTVAGIIIGYLAEKLIKVLEKEKL